MTEQTIPVGYKMTEVGIIPEDWDIEKLGGIAGITMGQSPLSQFYNTKGYGLPLIQGNADLKKRKTITRNYTSQITKKGKAGDIIMSVRAPVGEIGEITVDCCLGRGVCSINYPSKYLYYMLVFLEKNRGRYSTGSTFDSVNSKQVKDLDIKLPPTLIEQKLIATVLSDTDDLITSFDTLIEKKEKIKEGTMQELLTGKKRLPGFSGEWEEKKISDILNVTRGYVLSVNKMSSTKSENYKYPVYSSQTRNKGLTGFYKEYLYENSITWTTDGANAGDVNFREGKFYCTNVCGVLKSNNGHANLCVAKALGMISKKYVSYIGNPKLMNNVVADIELRLPPTIEEQKRIAEVLSSIDDEIAVLKEKRTKYKKIKQGMMQELLTGRIRLI